MRIIRAQQDNLNLEYSVQFPEWITEQIRVFTNDYKKALLFDKEDLSVVREWVYATNPDLSEIGLQEALNYAEQWEKNELSKNYKNNDVVYTFNHEPFINWTIVRLSGGEDIDIEKELMIDDDGDLNGAYDISYSYLKNKEQPPDEYKLVLFSLRNTNNIPHATIEMYQSVQNPFLLIVKEVYGKVFKETPKSSKTHLFSNEIEVFFDYLRSLGYIFSTSEGTDADYGSSSIELTDLNDMDCDDQFGIPYGFASIGGDSETYYRNLEKAYQEGWGGSTFYERRSRGLVDNLVNYAAERHELEELTEAVQKIEEWAQEAFFESEMQFDYTNPLPEEPNEKDFIIPPDIHPNQPEFSNMPEAKPKFDKEAYGRAVTEYDAALKLHDEERENYETYFEPYMFGNYAYREVQDAISKQSSENIEREKTRKNGVKIMAKNKTKIIKISNNLDDDKMPDANHLSLCVQTLKMYLKDNPDINKEYIELISKLPSPRAIKQDFSRQECKILYETVEYLWEKVAGQKIISDKIGPPETLNGNYLMMANGLLLKGCNFYDIVKRNVNLICNILDISGLTLQEYLNSDPDQLIKFIIKNGGARLFINENRELWCQCSPEIYGKWARSKIKKLNFKKKVIKVIDQNADYKGWKSGITILL